MASNLDQLKDLLRAFVKEREWERFHEPKDLALAIGIESGELGEHFLWKSVDEARKYLVENDHAKKVIEEIADIMIYCINLTNAIERITKIKVDLGQAIKEKIEKNAKKYPADVYKNKARLEKS